MFYLHQEGPNLGKTSCPLPPITIRLDAQFGTPYPRSTGFDTDTLPDHPLKKNEILDIFYNGLTDASKD